MHLITTWLHILHHLVAPPTTPVVHLKDIRLSISGPVVICRKAPLVHISFEKGICQPVHVSGIIVQC